MTSLPVTSLPVTSGSHATSGHAQWYILYYYYSKEKAREKCHFRACAGHTSVTNVTSGNFRSGPLPVTSLPVTTQFLLNHPLKYDLNRTDILLWTSSPRGYHPLNSQRYHLINTSEHLILRRHTITCETNTGVGFLSIMHY
jgi:hypothetical protein